MFLRITAAALALHGTPALAQPDIGERSPELGIEHLLNAPAGAEATLDALRGKLVVLEFWATWCGPCVGAIPHLNKLHETYQDRVVFISVTNENHETVQKFQQGEPAIANWIALDTDRSLFEAYGIRAIPATIVLDQNGRVVARTSPLSLTPERLDAYLSGERDTPARSDASTPLERVRAAMAMGAIAGADPVTGANRTPLTQFILRPTAMADQPMQFAFSSGDRTTMLGMGRDAIIRQFYRLPAALIDLSELPTSEGHFDFILGGAFPADLAQRLTLETFQAAEHRERRDIPVYRLVRAPGEVRNRAEQGRSVESHAEFKDNAVRVVHSQASAAHLCEMITGWLGTPCEDATGLDHPLRIDITYAMGLTPDQTRELLVEHFNLTLAEDLAEHEIVVIRPKPSAD